SAARASAQAPARASARTTRSSRRATASSRSGRAVRSAPCPSSTPAERRRGPAPHNVAMFHDRARLTVVAGRGGGGASHFRPEKIVPKGGPDGGDGGKGGDIVLEADPRRRDLSGFKPNQKLRAGRGAPGRGSLSNGADGDDALLRVPVGT